MEPHRFSLYDPIAEEYIAFVQAGLRDSRSVWAVAMKALLGMAGSTADLDVCDLACGEGYLARLLARQSRSVIGIDLSARLLEHARQQKSGVNAQYIYEDAQHLNSLPDSYFDLVVCNLALMDIPDLSAVYQAVERVLRSQGRFVFSITHPCFQSPHASDNHDAAGQFQARVVPRYAEEGAWTSRNKEGIRGKVGAIHRTVTTYLNGLMNAGFQLEQIAEPGAAGEQIPVVLVVAASVRKKHDE